MIRKFSRYQQKLHNINERIYAATLRVLDIEGKQIGVLSRQEALNKAREMGLDLVEIAPKANPPVAKIIDYNKFLYQLEKKKREEKKKSKASETKEIRLGPFMNSHDLEVVIRKATDFLEANNKIKFVVKFRGRQIVHPEFGHETLNKVLGALSEISKTERPAHFEGRQLITIISPERKKTNAEKENQEISK